MGPKICHKRFKNRSINTIFYTEKKKMFLEKVFYMKKKNQTKGSNYFLRKIFEFDFFLQEHVKVIINGTGNLLVALKSEHGW